MENLYYHQDLLAGLQSTEKLSEKHKIIHQAVRKHFPFINRIAIALYDEKFQTIKTYTASTESDNPLIHYEASPLDAPSLQEMIELRQPRVVNDLTLFEQGEHQHTQHIHQKGYQASYTFPMFSKEEFLGFIFFNASHKDTFSKEVLDSLDVYAHLLMGFVIYEQNTIKTMIAALKSAHDLIHFRDPETGNHLERMSRFARLIAIELARSEKYHFDDEFIEQIFLFAPLHDVGKIGIPDDILLKQDRLNKKEFTLMKTHTLKGREIINKIIDHFNLGSLEYIDILKHVAEHHHEAMDGSGYPHGLKGSDIPIEARIITVADIFDALTSVRPYKKAWKNEDAFNFLKKLAKTKLDEDCVAALLCNQTMVEKIQQAFQEE